MAVDTIELADLSGIILQGADDNYRAGRYSLEKGKHTKDVYDDFQEWDHTRGEFVRAPRWKRRRAADEMRAIHEYLERFASEHGTLLNLLTANSGRSREEEMTADEWMEYILHRGGTSLNAILNGETCAGRTTRNSWKPWAANTARDFGRAWNADGTIFINMEQLPGMRSLAGSSTMWNIDTQDFGDRGRSNLVNL